MTLSSLVKSTIINGANTLAVAAREGIVYRLQPVETVTEITFNNFTANEAKIFNLSESLRQDYKVIGLNVDLTFDDDEYFDDLKNNPRSESYSLNLRTFKGDKARSNYFLNGNSYAKELASFYLRLDDTLNIRLNKNVNSVTFYCIPIIFDEKISFS